MAGSSAQRRACSDGRRAAVALLVGVAPGLVATTTALGEGIRAPRLLKGPYLTALSDSGIDVRFELDVASSASVEISHEGGSPGSPRAFPDPAGIMHVVRASDLDPATRYAYVVRSGGKALGQGAFTTAPKPGSAAPLKFIVYGDDRTDPTAHAAVVRALAETASDFLVNTGDVVEDGGRAEDWQTFFDVEARLLRDRPLFVAIGNHELFDDRAGANFARYFGFTGGGGTIQPYGTARLGNTRFFFLNAMHDWTSGEEREWLRRELDRADDEAGLVWRIAVMHHGPWSSGPHGACAKLVEARVPELLVAHKVDLVFSGHDHIYERGEGGGMKYVVSGGGGAPLYRTSKVSSTRKCESTYHFVEVATAGDAVHLVAKRIDGSVLDECGFRKGGAWDCDVVPAASLSPPPPPLVASSSPRCGCALPGATSKLLPGAVSLAIAVVLAWARRAWAVGRRG
jgi:acid phosphatase type 7